MKNRITVTVNGVPTTVSEGTWLCEVTGGELPCGGHGKCGKCRVTVRGTVSPLTAEEQQFLSPAELAAGVRLSCLVRVLGDCEVTTEQTGARAQIVVGGALPRFDLAPSFAEHGVAIDVGTTTLAATLYHASGKPLASTSCINPQAKWGADVISRIEAALAGDAKALAGAIRVAIDKMIGELVASANVNAKEIGDVVITGNTVMLSLLVEETVEPLSHAPFAATRLFGETLTADELDLTSLSPNTTVYLPPCISAFVGADTTCAILATDLTKKNNALLVDIGTNGEIALLSEGGLTVTSTAAGPAFEGFGISCGMRGEEGAIDKVTLVNGTLHPHVIGGGTPKGICGSGLVDAVACMLDCEVLDESGFLEEDPYPLADGISLKGEDIRALQLAKSAIHAGIMTLIDEKGLTLTDIKTLFIAGGFGNYLNARNAKRIGLLPNEPTMIPQAVGNAALDGAAMLLLNQDLRRSAEKIAREATVLSLSTNKRFVDYYIEGMQF